MNNLSVKFSIVLAILLVVTSFSIQGQRPLKDFEKAWIEEENQNLRKAITLESMSEADRIATVRKNAVKLKAYGQPMAFPKGDIPLKTNLDRKFRLAMGRGVYTNDLRNVFNNLLMQDQLRMINSIQIEVAEEQIKFVIPGNGAFEVSKEIIGNVFEWTITEGVTGGKIGNTKDLVQKFKNLASSKELLAKLNKVYAEEKDLMASLFDQLETAEALQTKLRAIYIETYNGSFVDKDFKQPGGTPATTPNPVSTDSSADNFIKANTPFGWKVNTNKSGSWAASSRRRIIEKSAKCGEYFLDINVVATVSPTSETMSNGEIDKKLRSWMSESGWYPEEASIAAITIRGFKGRLLTTTLKYVDGFGSPMGGYKDGKAHIGGYAILVSDDGSRILKTNYYALAGSCWNNTTAPTSKKEAMSGKNEAEQVMRSITVMGMKSTSPTAPTSTYTSPYESSPPVSTIYPNPKNLKDEELREASIKALTSEPATKDEIEYWTEREKQIKKKPVKPQPKPEPEPKPKTKSKSSTEMIVGDWSLIANGFSGILEIRYDGTALQGRVFFKSIGRWEPLQDLQFDSSTGKFTFLRPNAKQYHEGMLNGSTLIGTFTGNYKWTATKTSQTKTNSEPTNTNTNTATKTTTTSNSSPSPTTNTSSADMLVGDWNLVANGFAGILEIRLDGSDLKGRIYFNSLRKWELLENLKFNASTGQFSFLRPNAKQQHEGVLNGTTLIGTFTGNYKWTATKTGGASR